MGFTLTELRRDAPVERGEGYTVIGVFEDGAGVSQTITDLNEYGIEGEDLTVVLKRKDPDQEEPFPEGTRYIIVPDDDRGLDLIVGFSIVFAICGLFFAFTTPGIGLPFFIFFMGQAAILAAGAFGKVGVLPILIDMQAPPEESGYWNEEFEKGKVLIFACSDDRREVKNVWRTIQDRAIYFDVIGKRLVPEPVNDAVIHQSGIGCDERLGLEAQEAG